MKKCNSTLAYVDKASHIKPHVPTKHCNARILQGTINAILASTLSAPHSPHLQSQSCLTKPLPSPVCCKAISIRISNSVSVSAIQHHQFSITHSASAIQHQQFSINHSASAIQHQQSSILNSTSAI